MNKLRGIWYTLVYFWEWLRFSTHYRMVWEPTLAAIKNQEELRELKSRMASGPMRFEFERIQRLRERAIDALCK